MQAVANSSLTAAIVRTGRIEADAPRGEAIEVAAQGALPAGATISPTQVGAGPPRPPGWTCVQHLGACLQNAALPA